MTTTGRRGRYAQDHFRSVGDMEMSSIGLGMRPGAPDEQTNVRYDDVVVEAARRGCNLFDTASSYRQGASEHALGQALEKVRRSELQLPPAVVCTKGRIAELPLRDLITLQIDRSRLRLRIERIDVYFLEGLERLDEAGRRSVLPAIFDRLERARQQGAIRCYGISSTEGLLRDPDTESYVPLERIVQVARSVAGTRHGLRFVQAPYSVTRPQAVTARNQPVLGESRSLIEATQELGLSFIAAQALTGGKALQEEHPWLSGFLTEGATRAQRMLQFARSTPGVTSALVGTTRMEHAVENLALAEVPRASRVLFDDIVPKTAPQLPWLWG